MRMLRLFTTSSSWARICCSATRSSGVFRDSAGAGGWSGAAWPQPRPRSPRRAQGHPPTPPRHVPALTLLVHVAPELLVKLPLLLLQLQLLHPAAREGACWARGGWGEPSPPADWGASPKALRDHEVRLLGHQAALLLDQVQQLVHPLRLLVGWGACGAAGGREQGADPPWSWGSQCPIQAGLTILLPE